MAAARPTGPPRSPAAVAPPPRLLGAGQPLLPQPFWSRFADYLRASPLPPAATVALLPPAQSVALARADLARPVAPASAVGDLRRALRELPPRSLVDRSAAERKRAVEATYGGRLYDAAILTEAACAEDGVISGVLKTITYGIPALAENWRGPEDVVRALQGTEQQPGDARRVVPLSERADMMRDGITLGAGIGRLLPRDHAGRRFRVLERYSPRNLTYLWSEDRWMLQTLHGTVKIAPPGVALADDELRAGVKVAGDGEWCLFLPYGAKFPWLKAPWLFLTLAYVLARDAAFLRSRHAEVYGPTRVGKVTDQYYEEHRQELAALLEQMRADNWLVLPPGTDYEVKGISGTDQSSTMYESIQKWAREQVEIGLTGNSVTVEGGKGFSRGDPQARIASHMLAFYGGAWGEFECGQVWPWYAADNVGHRHEIERYPVTGLPEDRLAEADAMRADADALQAIGAALKEHGLRATAESVAARAGRHGLKIEPLPKTSVTAAKVELAPSDAARCVKKNEFRAGVGLPPVPEGNAWVVADEPAQAQPGATA